MTFVDIDVICWIAMLFHREAGSELLKQISAQTLDKLWWSLLSVVRNGVFTMNENRILIMPQRTFGIHNLTWFTLISIKREWALTYRFIRPISWVISLLWELFLVCLIWNAALFAFVFVQNYFTELISIGCKHKIVRFFSYATLLPCVNFWLP